MMSVPPRYGALWIPGLAHEMDRDESLEIGFRWLASAERNHRGTGVVVMYAKSMVKNAPLLGQATQRWEFVSPRSSRPWGTGPVLAIWPPDSGVLEFAEGLALDSALCVIAGHYDIAPWVSKARASCLVQGYQMDRAEESLPQQVTQSLDAMLSFDGHNGFAAAFPRDSGERS